MEYWGIDLPSSFEVQIEKIQKSIPIDIPEVVLEKWISLGHLELDLESLDSGLKIVSQPGYNNIGDYYG